SPWMSTPHAHPFSPLVEVLRDRHEEIADRALAATTREIPVYAGLDRATLDEVQANIAHDLELLGRLFAVGGVEIGLDERLNVMTDADRDHLRSVAGRRARQGLALADFLHAYRVSQQVIWQELRTETAGDLTPEALLDAVEVLLGLLDYRITQAGHAYPAAPPAVAADIERIRRGLLEALLGGRAPATGERVAVANAAGLDGTHRFLLIAARPVGPRDDRSLGVAASLLNRAAGGALAPLTVVRQQEIVLVRAVDADGAPPGLIAGIGAAQGKLRDDGTTLAIGLSTVHAG